MLNWKGNWTLNCSGKVVTRHLKLQEKPTIQNCTISYTSTTETSLYTCFMSFDLRDNTFMCYCLSIPESAAKTGQEPWTFQVIVKNDARSHIFGPTNFPSCFVVKAIGTSCRWKYSHVCTNNKGGLQCCVQFNTFLRTGGGAVGSGGGELLGSGGGLSFSVSVNPDRARLKVSPLNWTGGVRISSMWSSTSESSWAT